jgi:hypothetical protein
MPGLQDVVRQISGELAADAEAVLLSQDQMMVRKHMVSLPLTQGFKAPTLAPARDGYAIYIRVTGPDPEKAPQQRPRPSIPTLKWNSVPGPLRLNREALEQSWQLSMHTGELVALTVFCGSDQVFDEVDRILAAISASWPK